MINRCASLSSCSGQGEAERAADVEGVAFRVGVVVVGVDDPLSLVHFTDADEAAESGGSGTLGRGVVDAAAAHFGQGLAVEFFVSGKIFESQHGSSPIV